MKIMKKISLIILIFLLIQIFGMIFTNNSVNASSFFDKVSNSGKAWREMGEGESDNLIENANSVFTAIDDIRDELFYLGVAIFFVVIFIAISFSKMDNSPESKAKFKVLIVFLSVMAGLFIFAGPILNWFVDIFTQVEELL